MRVLVAVDHSQASQLVIDEAATRPWPKGATFCLLNVVDARLFTQFPELVEDAKRQAHKFLNEGVGKLSHAGYEVISGVIVGSPRRAISAYAKEWPADLIMVGSHAHNVIGRFLLGSVAQGVLRTAPCSVEIARATIGGPVPSSHAMKILLATDGSDCSAAAAQSIATRPWPENTVMRILSVEEMLILDNQMMSSSLCSVYPSSLLEELMTTARDRAKSAVKVPREILQGGGKKVYDDQEVPVGDPRTMILEAAKTWGADLIVLGSHGRHGVDRFLLGSVSEGVATHAHCSVEVIRKQ